MSVIEKTSVMLDEEHYWDIVERSLEQAEGDQDAQLASLVSQIQLLTPTEMIGFRLRTDKLLYDSYNASLWCAGYIMNQGCSDDGFEYFRCWVISQGKEVFYKALANPDSLADIATDEPDIYDFESFWYVALDAFKQQTGESLYDYIDNENFTTKEGNYPQFEFNWEESDPESMKAICPRLFDKFEN